MKPGRSSKAVIKAFMESVYECHECGMQFKPKPSACDCGGINFKYGVTPRKENRKMSAQEVQAYVSELESEKKKVKAEIARNERTLSRIEEKLSDPEKYFAKEAKRNSLKVRRARGEKVGGGNKTSFKPKSESSVDSSENDEAAAVAGVLNDLRAAGYSTSSRYHDDDEDQKKNPFSLMR